MKLNNSITLRTVDFAKWYTDVITAAKLALYAPIKGTIIFQPNGWAIWNNIKNLVDYQFSKLGIENVQLPLFIKYSDFTQEKKHIEGFAPELFMVTKKGDELLVDPYVVRPTSEVSFCNYFKEIVKSYNDLPVKFNQWCNVFRVEKNTRPFLRNSEFQWQEMHSIHSSEDEAREFSFKLIKLYENLLTNDLNMAVLCGEKTANERFAGAEVTYTVEALMQDNQALQCGTSHYLGQNFSKIYDIKYQNKDNKFENVYQTSAGISTRLIGGIIMSHSDDRGLVLPFKIAPTQINIISLFKEMTPDQEDFINKIKNSLSQYRVAIDNSNKSMGFKIAESEVKGIPLTIIVGLKDFENRSFTLLRRDNLEKIAFSIDELNAIVEKNILDYSQNLYNKSQKRLESNIVTVKNLDEFKAAIADKKIALGYWCGDGSKEDEIKKLTGATPRCVKADVSNEDQKCFLTGKKATQLVYFARAY